MILRKPYAFFIKHIKLIHLLLIIPMVYLIIETRDIVTFFNTYIHNNYAFNTSTLISTLSSEYINIFMYIVDILLIIAIAIISIILQNKNKKSKIYNIIVVFYIALFFLITGALSIFTMIEENTLNNALANIIRDLSYIAYYPQYLIIFYFFIRGIGFNIKNFNFNSELNNLEIDKEDSEEIDLSFIDNSYKTKRSLRRFIRELKYYYLENKFIFTIMFIILIGGSITYIYVNREIVNKVYRENETVAFGYINFKVNDTYITDIGLNGNKIKDNKKYLILNMTITNRSYQDRNFNYTNIMLNVDNNKISPDITLGNYFKDYGNIYTNNMVKKDSTNSYILVYEIDSKLSTNKCVIEAYNGFDASTGGVGIKNIRIKLNPEIVNNNLITNNINQNTLINLSNTNLLNSSITIKDYLFTNRFEYTVNDTVRDIYIDISKDYNKTLMVLDYDLELDENSLYMKSKKDFISFFEDFVMIKYIVNDTQYTSDIKVLNPKNYSEKVVFKINNDILNASSIDVLINVRNVSYKVKLK